jgi:hypothetical protein
MVLSGNLTKSVDALLMPNSYSTGPVLLLNIREKVSPNFVKYVRPINDQ